MSVLLYGCTTGTLTKRIKKKLNGNYSKISGAFMNKSLKQRQTKQQFDGYNPKNYLSKKNNALSTMLENQGRICKEFSSVDSYTWTHLCWSTSKKLHSFGGCPRGVMVKAMACGIVVREFVLQSRYYVHFRANTLGKGMNPLILPAMG